MFCQPVSSTCQQCLQERGEYRLYPGNTAAPRPITAAPPCRILQFYFRPAHSQCAIYSSIAPRPTFVQSGNVTECPKPPGERLCVRLRRPRGGQDGQDGQDEQVPISTEFLFLCQPYSLLMASLAVYSHLDLAPCRFVFPWPRHPIWFAVTPPDPFPPGSQSDNRPPHLQLRVDGTPYQEKSILFLEDSALIGSFIIVSSSRRIAKCPTLPRSA